MNVSVLKVIRRAKRNFYAVSIVLIMLFVAKNVLKTMNHLNIGGIEMKKFNIEEMENYEVNEIKDDLVMLESQFEGSGYGNVLAKAFHYINYLEEKLVNIANNEERAIKILIENGYVVKKLTVGQLKDAKECEECGFEGDCSFCRCSICVVQ
jgi:hypothetical protein